MAVLFIAIVVSHLISCGTGAKWFIFMTDLGVMFLALHYVIDAVIVLCRWAWEKNNPKAHCRYSFILIFVQMRYCNNAKRFRFRIYSIFVCFPCFRSPKRKVKCVV